MTTTINAHLIFANSRASISRRWDNGTKTAKVVHANPFSLNHEFWKRQLALENRRHGDWTANP